MLPLFFTLTLLLMIWIYYQKSRTDRSAKSAHEAFWDKERKANLTRKKDISELDYIVIPMEQLPFPSFEDEEITEVQKQLQKLAEGMEIDIKRLIEEVDKETAQAKELIERVEF